MRIDRGKGGLTEKKRYRGDKPLKAEERRYRRNRENRGKRRDSGESGYETHRGQS